MRTPTGKGTSKSRCSPWTGWLACMPSKEKWATLSACSPAPTLRCLRSTTWSATLTGSTMTRPAPSSWPPDQPGLPECRSRSLRQIPGTCLGGKAEPDSRAPDGDSHSSHPRSRVLRARNSAGPLKAGCDGCLPSCDGCLPTSLARDAGRTALTSGSSPGVLKRDYPCEPVLYQPPLSAGRSGVGVQSGRDYLAVHGPIMRPTSGLATSPQP